MGRMKCLPPIFPLISISLKGSERELHCKESSLKTKFSCTLCAHTRSHWLNTKIEMLSLHLWGRDKHVQYISMQLHMTDAIWREIYMKQGQLGYAL